MVDESRNLKHSRPCNEPIKAVTLTYSMTLIRQQYSQDCWVLRAASVTGSYVAGGQAGLLGRRTPGGINTDPTTLEMLHTATWPTCVRLSGKSGIPCRLDPRSLLS